MSLFDYLPSIYKMEDVEGDLNAFLSLIEEHGINPIKSLIQGLFNFKSTEDCPEEFLNFLASNVGVKIVDSASEQEKRNYIKYAVDIWRRKGTLSSIFDAIQYMTGYNATVNRDRAIFYDGYESGDTSNWLIQDNGGSGSVLSSAAFIGSYGMRFTTTASSQGYYLYRLGLSLDTSAYRKCYFRLNSSGFTGSGWFIGIGEWYSSLDGIGIIPQFHRKTDGTFEIRLQIRGDIGNTISINSDTWICLETRAYNLESNNVRVEMYLDGSLVDSLTGLDLRNIIFDRAYEGLVWSDGGITTMSFDIDESEGGNIESTEVVPSKVVGISNNNFYRSVDTDDSYMLANIGTSGDVGSYLWYPNQSLRVLGIKISGQGWNYLQNPYMLSSFQEDSNLEFFPWQIIKGDEVLVPEFEDYLFGNNSLKVTILQWGGITTKLEVFPAGTYTFSAYVKADNMLTNFELRLTHSDLYNSVTEAILSNQVIGQNWIRLEKSITFNVPGRIQLSVSIPVSENQNGSFWVDGVKFEEGSSATSVVESEDKKKFIDNDIWKYIPAGSYYMRILYDDESIDCVENFPVVTGENTIFRNLVRAGDILVIYGSEHENNGVYEIENVISDTLLGLTSYVNGKTFAGERYFIGRMVEYGLSVLGGGIE